LAALAMGLQNATITKISGAVVRTTHVTGVITDLGLESVQLFLWWHDKMAGAKAGRYTRLLKVSRRHPTALRVLLLASILGSFMVGAVLGTIALVKLGPSALIAPILFLIWIVIVDFFKPIADVRQIDPTHDTDLANTIGPLKSLLPPQVGIFRLAHHRSAKRHHAPDFSGWAQRVPKQWRVIILVVSSLTQFDQDSATSLLAAIQRLSDSGRDLVISGMNRRQFKTLMDCGLSNVIDMDNFVPDIEFAIARAMNLAARFGA
jgi:anti-anti-sigma regulatory factor